MSLKDQPQFRTIHAPDSYARTTSAPVRYVPVLKDDTVIGYLWAATSDDAAQYVPREQAGDPAFDAAVAWTGRLRWAKASGVTPLAALRHWAGESEDARAGRVPVGAPFELPSLRALEELAAAG
ncbi:hypothetical protein MF672_012930 [Actinomadura sp. ATCC 31491]|uniref:Uncharacterized protein n=1 Tax=Actinomadura luzonensis TaxID=2805427 RepID=A0ABT0FQT5_9ACTN|nr:hypothetical protein [Actinomadura luzonensis]MCK2214691.1 hypothetical protein [Actinomadura luzonensis]